MKKLLFLSAFALFVVACANETTKEEPRKDGFSAKPGNRLDSLEKDVMDGHNAGMPRMKKISDYQVRIQQSLDSLAKLPASKVDKSYQQALAGLKEELSYAEMSMNTWMDEYSLDSFENDTEQRIKYLESERAKVLKVKEAIFSSLAKADSMFRK